MKKGLILLVFLILLPSALATITLEGPSKDVYNVGDRLDVSGIILENKDYYGLFKIDLECDGNTQQLLVKSVSVRGNEELPYKEEFSVTPGILGSCSLKAGLVVNNNELDSVRGRGFRITKDLLGKFIMQENKLQLGRTLSFEGDISRVNNDNINGVAHIYFKKNNQVSFSDNVQIKKGHWGYEKDTSNLDTGDYLIDIQAEDDRGNEFLFANALSLGLVNEIVLAVETDKVHVFPGKKVRISGRAVTISSTGINRGTAAIEFEEEKITTDVFLGGFAYELKIDQNIKSGPHKINVVVQDNYGNRGTAELEIIVDPVLTGLNLNLDRENYIPNQTITVNPSLVDQASDLMDKEVEIIMINAKGKEVFTGKFRTNQDVKLKLADLSLPGTWKLKAKVDKLKTEKEFKVEIVNLLEMKIENQSLLLNNIGNVPYNQRLEILLKGEGIESTFKEDVDLDVNESTLINLAYGTPTGKYDVYVQDQIFKNLNITGEEVRSYRWVVYVILLFLLFILLYVIANWRRWKIKAIRDRVERKKAGELRKKLMSEKPRGYDEAKAVKDYRLRMMEHIEKGKKKSPFGLFSKLTSKKDEDHIILGSNLPRSTTSSSSYGSSGLWGSSPSSSTNRTETSWEKRVRERRERFERKKGKGGSGEEGGMFKMFG